MNTFYLVDKESGQRVRKLTPDEARSIVAVKKGRASPEEEPHSSLTQKMRRDQLGIECGCRPDLQRGPLLGTRRNRDGRTFIVNLPNQDVAHAKVCVFRVERPAMPPIVHSDVFKLSSRAHADHGDIDPDFPVHRKSRGLWQGQPPRTMRGILWTLMHTARLHRLAVADGFSSSRGWLAAIGKAAEQFYLPPKVPASEFLFTDPKSWNSGEVGRRLDDAGQDWIEFEESFALLCWPALDVSEYEVNDTNRELGPREGAHPGGPSDNRRQSGSRAVPDPPTSPRRDAVPDDARGPTRLPNRHVAFEHAVEIGHSGTDLDWA